MTISEQSVRSIRDYQSLLNFLRDDLDWQLPANPALEDVTFRWTSEDLNLDLPTKEKISDGVVYQLQPMIQDQPWGIFLLNFNNENIYKSHLRKILRQFIPKRNKHSDLPSWKFENILFICTTSNQNFTFAHFEGENPGNAKLITFSWNPEEPIRTICEFNLPALIMPEKDLIGYNTSLWLSEWKKAFDIKAVTDEFYKELKNVFIDIQQHFHNIPKNFKPQFSQLLLNRLLFLKFLERKGWLFVTKNDILAERRGYLNRQKERHPTENLWRYFFYYLFFKGLNRKVYYGTTSHITNSISELIGYVPFLNGGLFEESKNWNDLEVKVDNEAFNLIFDKLLNKYNFTIQENTPLEIEIALNPDLLGYAYEEMIAEQHGQGAYYTHPTEVGLMCRESIRNFLIEHSDINNDKISELIYNEKTTLLTEEESFKIYSKLLNIKILDPAVGSGAYPVRMMQELVSIYRKLAEKMTEGQFRYIFQNKLANPRNVFDLKLNIIQNNLYGVDIDSFAVEIAKLRFWLSLVVDYEEEVKTSDDLIKIPALPNLDFKLRVGESLIASPGKGRKQEKHGKKGKGLINLDTHFLTKCQTLDAFFYLKTDELRKLKEKFFNFESLKKVDKELSNISKADLKIEVAEKENDLAKELGFVVDDDIENVEHILWQIHFCEIFSEKSFGFDICIANPPYLRQEKINELFAKFKMGITKDDLVKSYEEIYKDQKLKINKQSDIYLYFYIRAVNLLREKGVLCFICSNSWLDVAYGSVLQKFLIKNTRIKTIFDNAAKRSFEKADVNTTINVFVKDSSANGNSDDVARFVTFKRSFEISACKDDLDKIYKSNEITSSDSFRVYPIIQKDLWKQGLDEEGDYIGDKWGGKYLRAPDIFFKILEKGKFVKLGDIASIKAGMITGNNSEYYTKRSEGFDKEKFSLVFKSPREVNKIIISKSDAKSIIKIKNVPYELRKAPLLWVDLRGDKHICHFNKNNLLYEHNFYGIIGEKIDNQTLCLYLNSTLVWFLIEILGRSGLGGGAIRLVRIDLLKFPFLFNLNLYFENFKNFTERKINSTFVEVGIKLTKPIRSQQPKPLPDRKALDDIIFDELGLTEEERKEVYWSVCELVQNRLRKARSV